MKDHNGAVPARETNTPWARAYYPKLDQLLASGRHPDTAHWEARQHALAVQEREISGSDAAHNAAVIAALGTACGSEEEEAFDWDSTFADVNANRR